MNLLRPNCPVFMPFYHGVAELPASFQQPLYRVPTPQQFEQELDKLLRHFHPLSLAEYMKNQRVVKVGNKPIMILSFDDGLQSIYAHVAPMLLRKGVPAVFFVNSAFVDNKSLFYRYKAAIVYDQCQKLSPQSAVYNQLRTLLGTSQSITWELLSKLDHSGEDVLDEVLQVLSFDIPEFLANEKPYMSLRQLKDLEAKGFLIGSHGFMHFMYNKLCPSERLADFTSGMDFIKSNFHPPILSFSFPFTDAGLTYAEVEQLKRAHEADVFMGCAGFKKEKYPWHLQRVPMDDFRHVPGHLWKMYAEYRVKQLMGRHMVKR